MHIFFALPRCLKLSCFLLKLSVRRGNFSLTQHFLIRNLSPTTFCPKLKNLIWKDWPQLGIEPAVTAWKIRMLILKPKEPSDYWQRLRLKTTSDLDTIANQNLSFKLKFEKCHWKTSGLPKITSNINFLWYYCYSRYIWRQERRWCKG